MSTSRSRWSAIIAAQTVSGLPVSRFCGVRGISTTSFYRWRRELEARGRGRPGRRAPSPGVHREPAFIEAVVKPLAASDRGVGADECGAPIVALRCGRRIVVPTGFDDATLSRLVLALERLESSTPEARP